MHPCSKDSDADVGCRWLCMTAGNRTLAQEDELAEILRTLPHEARALVIPQDIIHRAITTMQRRAARG